MSEMKKVKIGDKVKIKNIKPHQIDLVYTVEGVKKDGKEANLGMNCWENVENLKKYNG